MRTVRLTLRPGVIITPSARELRELRARIRAGSTVDANGCWIWQQSTRNGYGQISIMDVNVYTHRLSYQLFIGEIPRGRMVLHACDVQRCNNPAHFFCGTQFANVRDMWRKGRAAAQRRTA